MREILLVAGTDLRRRLADRATLLVAFVAPVALAVVIGLALGSVPNLHVRLAVVDLDRGPAGAAVRAALADQRLVPAVTAVPAPDQRAAAALVRDGRVDAALVVPDGASSGAGADVAVLDRDDRPAAAAVARSLASAFSTRRDAVLAGGAGAVATIDSALTSRSAGPDLPPVAFYGPAFAVLFALFLTGAAARQWVAERRSRVLARTVLAPVAAGRIVAGKALGAAVLCAVSMGSCLGTLGVLFGVRWGTVPATAAVIAAASLAFTALGAAIAVVVTRDDQASAAGSLLGFVLGVVGGNLVARHQLPPALQVASAFTPNGWAGRAFDRLATDGGGIGSVLVPLAVLAACTVALGVVVSVRSRRLLLP